MPQRKLTKRIPSEPVQGEDSWVEVRPLTWAEEKDLSALDNDEDKARVFLEKVIAGWNWVNYDGTPLAQVREDPAVLLQLTGPEIRFVVEAMQVDAKN